MEEMMTATTMMMMIIIIIIFVIITITIFIMICSLIYRGFWRTLTLSDMWDLPARYKGQAAITKFHHTLSSYTKGHVTWAR